MKKNGISDSRMKKAGKHVSNKTSPFISHEEPTPLTVENEILHT